MNLVAYGLVRNFHQSFISMRNLKAHVTPTNLAPPWGLHNQNLLQARHETDVSKQMSCDVVFGSPSADCRGTGVCRITARAGGTPTTTQHKQRCRSTMGLLFPIEGGKGLTMILTRSLLCTTLYKTHLRHGKLTLESPCQLPKDVKKALGLKFSELSPGEYPVYDSEGILRIDFLMADFK